MVAVHTAPVGRTVAAPERPAAVMPPGGAVPGPVRRAVIIRAGIRPIGAVVRRVTIVAARPRPVAVPGPRRIRAAVAALPRIQPAVRGAAADGRRRRRLQPFAFKGLLLALDVQPLFVGHVAGGLRHLAALHLPLHPPLHVEPLLVGHLGPGGRERGPGKDNEQGRKQGRGQGTSAVGRDHGRLTGIKGLGPVVRARGAAPGANVSIEHPPRSSAQGEKMPARGSHAVAPQARPDAAETAALQRISLASEPEQDRLGAM